MRTNNLEKDLKNYESFDGYMASGEFARLNQSEMLYAYNFYRNSNSLDRREKRSRIEYDSRRTVDDEPFEDLTILQPEGSRACLNWEIDRKGFQIDDNFR